MRIKLNRAANLVIRKKVWRDKQIKGIVSDLSTLEDTIRDNWDTIGHINRGVLYSSNDYIDKYRFNPYSNRSSFFILKISSITILRLSSFNPYSNRSSFFIR